MAIAVVAGGCARAHPPSSQTTTTGASASRPLEPPPENEGLDPATREAAEHAVVPDTRITPGLVPPPLPRTVAPPSSAPTATPAAPQTGVPVTPRGHAQPEIVPAEAPLGIPKATADAGGR